MTKSNWADLPTEILRKIMEKLFWSERLPSCLVKKTWHECFLEIQNEQQFLPWVLSYGRGGICRLGDPSVQAASCIVKETNIDLLDDAVACASRDGWVLFEKKLDDPDNTLSISYYQYFLYSPFTDEVIKFPKLKMGHNRKATLFQSPSSPGCMVVISFSTLYPDLRIKTCHPGDKSWKILELKFGSRPCGYEYESITDLACAGDFVYCVLTERELGLRPKDDKCYIKMGAFNIKQQDWKVFSGSLPDINICWHQCLSVTFKGDILVQINNDNRRRLQFCRFDLSEEKWVDVDDEIIKKQVIFTAGGTSFTEGGYTSFTVPAVRDARQYAGMVFSLDSYFCYECDFTCFPFDHIPDFPRDSSHQWVNEDYKWLKEDGVGSVLEAECWGLYEGLDMAWKTGHRQVIVETDSLCLVQLLAQELPVNHPLFSIIQGCFELISADWCCVVKHVFREGNRLADSLARLGHGLAVGIRYFEAPPLEVYSFFQDDWKGLAIPRSYRSSPVS